MPSKIDISQIKLEQLDASSLVWITKFAHALEKRSGKTMTLRDTNVLEKVVREAKRTDSAELKEIYASLKQSLKNHINSQSFAFNIDPCEFSEQVTFPNHASNG